MDMLGGTLPVFFGDGQGGEVAPTYRTKPRINSWRAWCGVSCNLMSLFEDLHLCHLSNGLSQFKVVIVGEIVTTGLA